MNVAVIICAAGSSSRFGGKKKKIFIELCGTPVLLRSVNIFSEIEDVKQIILAISAEDEEKIRMNWEANLAFAGVELCIGGNERCQTVQNALNKVREDIDIVAIHDAARCCVTTEWVTEVFAKAFETGAATLASPVVATLKKAKNNVITSTVDRTNLYEAQTPQVFERKLILDAYDKIGKLSPNIALTDDCSVVEAIGKEIAIIETDSSNIKITKQADITIAQAVIQSREKKTPRPLHPFQEDLW